jgi:hypothetical protein
LSKYICVRPFLLFHGTIIEQHERLQRGLNAHPELSSRLIGIFQWFVCSLRLANSQRFTHNPHQSDQFVID